MTLLPTVGQLEVFPPNRERIKQKKKPFEEQTIVLQVENDFSKYYATFLEKAWGLEVERPAFGTHVTVNNGAFEIPNLTDKMDYLNSINGQVLTVQYSPEIYRVWEFFAVKVYSDELNAIRETLELPPKSYFHITIGKIHPNMKRDGLWKRLLE